MTDVSEKVLLLLSVHCLIHRQTYIDIYINIDSDFMLYGQFNASLTEGCECKFARSSAVSQVVLFDPPPNATLVSPPVSVYFILLLTLAPSVTSRTQL